MSYPDDRWDHIPDWDPTVDQPLYAPLADAWKSFRASLTPEERLLVDRLVLDRLSGAGPVREGTVEP